VHVAGVVVESYLHGRPLDEKARVQVLSHGVPEVVSVDNVYAVGCGLPVGAPEAMENCLGKLIGVPMTVPLASLI